MIIGHFAISNLVRITNAQLWVSESMIMETWIHCSVCLASALWLQADSCIGCVWFLAKPAHTSQISRSAAQGPLLANKMQTTQAQ